ncbi:U3 small nucleolar RNA-associated protein 4 [Babesia caballi]|uniref:U3 small nucleolar RNA-associated protein 4 n=1 Tax=Babesia caballi TaxID=5871 RepID=A0AAV4LLE7_BABCB|nr:U3 small nucleolar RNA-associated protein 4 [Babesia caballi]
MAHKLALVRIYDSNTSSVNAVAFSPCGQYIAAARQPFAVEIYNVETRVHITSLRESDENAAIRTIIWIPKKDGLIGKVLSGYRIVTIGLHAVITDWDLELLLPVRTCCSYGGAIFAASLTHCGTCVLIACDDGQVRSFRLWSSADRHTREPELNFEKVYACHSKSILSVCALPDGSFFCGTSDAIILKHDPASRAPAAKIKVPAPKKQIGSLPKKRKVGHLSEDGDVGDDAEESGKQTASTSDEQEPQGAEAPEQQKVADQPHTAQHTQLGGRAGGHEPGQDVGAVPVPRPLRPVVRAEGLARRERDAVQAGRHQAQKGWRAGGGGADVAGRQLHRHSEPEAVEGAAVQRGEPGAELGEAGVGGDYGARDALCLQHGAAGVAPQAGHDDLWPHQPGGVRLPAGPGDGGDTRAAQVRERLPRGVDEREPGLQVPGGLLQGLALLLLQPGDAHHRGVRRGDHTQGAEPDMQQQRADLQRALALPRRRQSHLHTDVQQRVRDQGGGGPVRGRGEADPGEAGHAERDSEHAAEDLHRAAEVQRRAVRQEVPVPAAGAVQGVAAAPPEAAERGAGGGGGRFAAAAGDREVPGNQEVQVPGAPGAGRHGAGRAAHRLLHGAAAEQHIPQKTIRNVIYINLSKCLSTRALMRLRSASCSSEAAAGGWAGEGRRQLHDDAVALHLGLYGLHEGAVEFHGLDFEAALRRAYSRGPGDCDAAELGGVERPEAGESLAGALDEAVSVGDLLVGDAPWLAWVRNNTTIPTVWNSSRSLKMRGLFLGFMSCWVSGVPEDGVGLALDDGSDSAAVVGSAGCDLGARCRVVSAHADEADLGGVRWGIRGIALKHAAAKHLEGFCDSAGMLPRSAAERHCAGLAHNVRHYQAVGEVAAA